MPCFLHVINFGSFHPVLNSLKFVFLFYSTLEGFCHSCASVIFCYLYTLNFEIANQFLISLVTVFNLLTSFEINTTW